MILINYLIEFIFNKYLKKISTINTAELSITVNLTDYKIIAIDNEALKKVYVINTAESQIIIILMKSFLKYIL